MADGPTAYAVGPFCCPWTSCGPAGHDLRARFPHGPPATAASSPAKARDVWTTPSHAGPPLSMLPAETDGIGAREQPVDNQTD